MQIHHTIPYWQNQRQLNSPFTDQQNTFGHENMFPKMAPKTFLTKGFLLAVRLLVAMVTSGCHPYGPSVKLSTVQKKRPHGRVQHTQTHTPKSLFLKYRKNSWWFKKYPPVKMMAYSMSASHTSTHVNAHSPKHTRTHNPVTTLPMNAHRNWKHTSVLQNSWWCGTGLLWVFMCQHSTAHSTSPPHTHKHRHSMLNLSPDYNLNLILLHIPCLSIKIAKTKDLSVWSSLKSAEESTPYCADQRMWWNMVTLILP